MRYGTIHISPECKKKVKQYALDNDTSIKKVVEQALTELISNSYVITSKPLIIKE